MSKMLSYRLATMEDSRMLLDWRNDPETRQASHDSAEIQLDDHIAWLSSSLADPNRKLFIAEYDGTPVGTVRADLQDGIWQLSWTVSPGARGKGIAKRMVARVAGEIPDPIRAEIKSDNTASEKVAKFAGMEFEREANGVRYFFRGSLS